MQLYLRDKTPMLIYLDRKPGDYGDDVSTWVEARIEAIFDRAKEGGAIQEGRYGEATVPSSVTLTPYGVPPSWALAPYSRRTLTYRISAERGASLYLEFFGAGLIGSPPMLPQETCLGLLICGSIDSKYHQTLLLYRCDGDNADTFRITTLRRTKEIDQSDSFAFGAKTYRYGRIEAWMVLCYLCMCGDDNAALVERSEHPYRWYSPRPLPRQMVQAVSFLPFPYRLTGLEALDADGVMGIEPGSYALALRCAFCGGQGGFDLDGCLWMPYYRSLALAEGWRIEGELCQCPSCAMKDRIMADPNELLQIPLATRKRMFSSLNEHFDLDDGRYKSGWSDRKVAETAGVDVETVRLFRRVSFGEIVESAVPDEAIEGLAAELKSLRSRAEEVVLDRMAQAEEPKLREMATQTVEVILNSDELKKALEGVVFEKLRSQYNSALADSEHRLEAVLEEIRGAENRLAAMQQAAGL